MFSLPRIQHLDAHVDYVARREELSILLLCHVGHEILESVVHNTHEVDRIPGGNTTYYEILVHNNCDTAVVVQFVENAGEDLGTWQLEAGGDFKQHCSDGYPDQHDCHGYKGFNATFPRH